MRYYLLLKYHIPAPHSKRDKKLNLLYDLSVSLDLVYHYTGSTSVTHQASHLLMQATGGVPNKLHRSSSGEVEVRDPLHQRMDTNADTAQSRHSLTIKRLQSILHGRNTYLFIVQAERCHIFRTGTQRNTDIRYLISHFGKKKEMTSFLNSVQIVFLQVFLSINTYQKLCTWCPKLHSINITNSLCKIINSS